MAVLTNAFSINGIIDTNKTVLQNLETIASAAGAWLSYDIAEGKWAVVINKIGSSVKSFTDSNIIGGINLSGTGLTELYNSVEISFPHKDLKDRTDFISYTIPAGELFPNEPDNKLTIAFDCVNDPVQAALLASRELKQSRIDKVIQFRTDFTSIGLKAGDLIDITNDAYGYTNKIFRITRIEEEDADDGVILLSITALEYDEDVYDDSGLVREERSIDNGIVAKVNNPETLSKDNEASLPLDLSSIAKALGLLLVFNSVTGRYELSQGGAQVTIDATAAVITWTFVDGVDLDIRCRMYSPYLGQATVDDYIGWTGEPLATNSTAVWPPSPATPVLIWGGDNTGVGQEQVYINLAVLKAAYPSQRYFIVECRGNWYGTPGFNPVKLDCNLYEGGSLVSTPISANLFALSVSGYTKGRTTQGVSVYVDSNTVDPTALGDLMGFLVFDAQQTTAQFVNDLTGFI